MVAECEDGSGAATADVTSSPSAKEASAGSAGGSSLVAVRREAFDIVSRFRVNSVNTSHKTWMNSLDMPAAKTRPETSLDSGHVLFLGTILSKALALFGQRCCAMRLHVHQRETCHRKSYE